MSLIKRGPDDLRYEPALQTVVKQLMKGKCLFFLGAGASVDPTQASLPTGRALSKLLAEKCRLEWHDYIPLSTIAFYYESFFTRRGLNDLLVEQLDPRRQGPDSFGPAVAPSTTIQRLIEVIALLEERHLKTVVVTTNYDQQFERAYLARFGILPDIAIYRGGWNPNDRTARLHLDGAGDVISPLWIPEGLTGLYKMHGCLSQVKEQSLVVTEEDYINFLTNALGENPDNRLLWFVRSKLETSTILFLGYSLADWNFRTIFKATVERRENKDMRSYAVQLHEPRPDRPDLLPLAVDFWHDKRVDIVNLPADEFVSDLLAALRAEIAAKDAHAPAARR
jgi:hypothetical protein